MRNRVLIGTLVFIFILLITLTNSYILLSGLIILSNISIYELNRALKKIEYKPLRYVQFLFNTLFLILIKCITDRPIFILFIIYCFSIFVLYVLIEEITLNEVFITIFISLYITVPYAILINLSNKIWAFYAFMITGVVDTCAFFVGISIGKHKLIERLSPKKTIEGSIGGIVGALIFTFCFILIFKLEHRISIYILSFVISIFSQIGDLFASSIKREVGIKDYGTKLNTHGGIMDRFDSIVMIAPLIYLLDYLMRYI